MTAIDDCRFAPGTVEKDGTHCYTWQLTEASLKDAVIFAALPDRVLPVIFVPGIMGSNLRNKKSGKASVWRLDSTWHSGPLADAPLGFALKTSQRTAGERQSLLVPSNLEVDPEGAVPTALTGSVVSRDVYTARGWGEVGEGSYGAFLLWLEQALNGRGYNPADWPQFQWRDDGLVSPSGGSARTPLTSGMQVSMPGLPARGEKGALELTADDLIARARFRMPVYACGYNWLEDNKSSAKTLAARIVQVIAEHNHPGAMCQQVVLVTHSMGGLVARACQQLPGMQAMIAGVVHGVMPSVGAAVAYRRCKVGMRDEDMAAGLVLGNTGEKVTAVFAQSPGALQLLPTRQYSRDWLTIDHSSKSINREPASGDPYKDIYARRDRWWGLIREEWLSPKGGSDLTWDVFKENLDAAEVFHSGIANAFHPCTCVFYGNSRAQTSFEGIHWGIHKGEVLDGSTKTPEAVAGLSFKEVTNSGTNPLWVGPVKEYDSETKIVQTEWFIKCAGYDGGGDGTVPTRSGAHPRVVGGACIQEQLGIEDIKHEGAYRESTVLQTATLYALQKIAAVARVD